MDVSRNGIHSHSLAANSYSYHIEQAHTAHGHDAESVDSDRLNIYHANDNPNQIVTFAPKERFRLGYFDVICLVLNRMIGTGIFESPQRVMRGTRSTGASLLLWFGGIIYCLCGAHVYIEYGLNIPRYTINGVEQSVPRSGGDLNYLQYVYPWPALRKNTVLLSACSFGAGFIAFGNMASNCVSFATRLLRAADIEAPSNGTVRGIAIAMATLACFIHAFSRRGGIWLNNVLAVIKVLMLVSIIVTAVIVGAGGLPKTENYTSSNTSPANSFDRASRDANGYSQAFLAIVYAFSGFDQPNYVMGEISRPRTKFPIAMITGVSTVCLLYMAVNISYMVVVPKDAQVQGEEGIAQQFFELSLGAISSNNTGKRIFNAFLAVSSVGNIIVMTYTATRVKQEIAKEGFLPAAKFFAQNTDMSLGRLLRWLQRKGLLAPLVRRRWLSPEEHNEKTPVGAFALHLLACLVLIFATWNIGADGTYHLLSNLNSYVINGIFGTFLGVGILILRFRGPPATEGDDVSHARYLAPHRKTWREMTGKHFKPIVSIACAVIYTIGNLWPIVAAWVKPNDDLMRKYKWWIVPTISWVVVCFGAVFFLGFVTVTHSIDRKHQKVFVVEKKPEFESAYGGDGPGTDRDAKDGGLVMVHETVYLSWVGRETLRLRLPQEMTDMESLHGRAVEAGHGRATGPVAIICHGPVGKSGPPAELTIKGPSTR